MILDLDRKESALAQLIASGVGNGQDDSRRVPPFSLGTCRRRPSTKRVAKPVLSSHLDDSIAFAVDEKKRLESRH